MQFSDMQTALQRYGFDTSDPIALWLNAAMHDFETRADWDCLESNKTVILVPAATNTVTVPSDFGKVIDLRDYDNNRKLFQYNQRKFDREIQNQTYQGHMEIYMVQRNNLITVYQTPQVNTNVQLWYQVAVPDMVNPTDVPGPVANPFPSACHYPIVVRAAAIALMAENEEQRASTALTEFNNMLIPLVGKFAGERTLDDVETVADVMGYSTDMSGRFGGMW